MEIELVWLRDLGHKGTIFEIHSKLALHKKAG
jgi:hypothetical protein